MLANIMTEALPIPSVSGPRIHRFWGLVPRNLARCLSRIVFGSIYRALRLSMTYLLVSGLKGEERVRVEEAAAMQIARAAGMLGPNLMLRGEPQ